MKFNDFDSIVSLLTRLFLGSNLLLGVIPDELIYCSNLNILDLSVPTKIGFLPGVPNIFFQKYHVFSTRKNVLGGINKVISKSFQKFTPKILKFWFHTILFTAVFFPTRDRNRSPIYVVAASHAFCRTACCYLSQPVGTATSISRPATAG